MESRTEGTRTRTGGSGRGRGRRSGRGNRTRNADKIASIEEEIIGLEEDLAQYKSDLIKTRSDIKSTRRSIRKANEASFNRRRVKELEDREAEYLQDESDLVAYIAELNEFLEDARKELESLKSPPQRKEKQNPQPKSELQPQPKPKPKPKQQQQQKENTSNNNDSKEEITEDETVTVSVELSDHTYKKLSVKKSEDWEQAVRDFVKENKINKEGEDSIMSGIRDVFEAK